ncbi:MAG: DNA polymerase I [Chthonomonadaceae bacterium]|nr:DNA polymerase I [Chthonomonadaceae bacterium]
MNQLPDLGQKKLVVIDGFSLLFRAFYGTRFLSTSDGRPTNALFGFVNTLIQLFGELKPDAVVVALDAPGKTFRHADFAEYKGTRRETPEELVSQLVTSRDMIAALNIPVLEEVGFEADDLVGSISLLAESKGYDTVIVTGDRDNLQLVDNHVTVMMPGIRGAEASFYDPQRVVEKYGFEPMQLIDYKAMAGDASDNIPGVPGIGDKTATLLVQRFSSCEELVERIDELEEKYRKKIEPMIEQMMLCKGLATICRTAPVVWDWKPFHIDVEHLAKVREMVESLEFKSQAKRLEAALGPYMSEQAKTHAVVHRDAIDAALIPGQMSFDKLKSFVGDSHRYGVFVSNASDQPSMFGEASDQEAFVAVGQRAARVSFDDAVRLLALQPERAGGHDLKPLYKTSHGYPVAPPAFDSLLAGYVLQSGRSQYELDDLCQGYLDTRPRYAHERAVAVLMLEPVMRDKLVAEKQDSVLDDIELPLVPILAEMETWGITVNCDYLREFSKTLEVSVSQSRALVHEMAGIEFNIGSPKQLGEVLFEKLQIPGGKKTKTGWATGAEVLAEIDHEIAKEIINYRELTKLKSTYADSIPKLVAQDGRVHTTFNQTVAATGRLSSIDPNLQNIPVRTELGRQVRKAFEAAPGYQLASFDYSQIELRVLAHMSRDPNLVEAFQKRVDVHTVTAAAMFKVSEKEVTKDQRRLAKLLNYAVLYGVTDFGLASQLGEGFSRTDAAELIKTYNERFPTVKAFTEAVVADARSTGFTKTLSGRRRFFADIHAANRGVRQYAERQAMNAPIQGTAADMIKIAMIRVHKSLKGTGHRMLLQVHDELVFEVQGDPAANKSLFKELSHEMESAIELSVPVEVDGKVGANWLEMTSV